MGSCLFVLPWIPTGAGGVNESVFGLAHELESGSRFRPLIGVMSWSHITLPSEVRGIPVIGLKLHGGYDMGLWQAAKSLAWLPRELTALARLLRFHDVQVVNITFPEIAGAAFFFLRYFGLYKGRIALTFQGADIVRVTGLQSSARFAWKHYIRSADVVFACSRALAAKVRSICPEKQPRVVNNAADVALFSRVTRLPGSGSKRILHIGKFEHKKSQDVLLAALQLLMDRGLDCRLTMIGATGPTLEQVREAVARFGDRVSMFVDVTHDQIPGYMANCDLFVLPSRAEGFPLVLIEAGAAGLPVVATNIGGIDELITDNTNGLLVEPGDPRTLADAIARVLESDELAERLAAKLRADAVHYTWRRAADEVIAALSGDLGRERDFHMSG
jgi:glycosyltransferase involved in cell wall biosynthesis